jgi:mannose-6-phosphate isomerase-like protein (cupin superfamily)
MLRPGDVLENPVTGERLIIHETSSTSNGEILRYEGFIRPRGMAAYEHIHPHQQEHHRVLDGVLRMLVAGREETLRPGESTTVPVGVPHKVVGGSDEVHVMLEFRPALRWEELLETWIALARDGKLNKRGFPNPLQAAVMAHEYRDEVYAARPPLAVQKAATAVLAPLGRLVGYRAPYVTRE